jgi:hypothetical protein
VLPANRFAPPAPQGRAILLLEAHLSLHALRVPLEPTLVLANEAAATALQARTALIQPSVLRFVPQALTVLPRAALLPNAKQASFVLRKGLLNKCPVPQAIIAPRVNKVFHVQLARSPREQVGVNGFLQL